MPGSYLAGALEGGEHRLRLRMNVALCGGKIAAAGEVGERIRVHDLSPACEAGMAKNVEWTSRCGPFLLGLERPIRSSPWLSALRDARVDSARAGSLARRVLDRRSPVMQPFIPDTALRHEGSDAKTGPNELLYSGVSQPVSARDHSSKALSHRLNMESLTTCGSWLSPPLHTP